LGFTPPPVEASYLYLVLNLAQKELRRSPRERAMAKAQFAIIFEGRFKLA
jgi:hypothetical protein